MAIRGGRRLVQVFPNPGREWWDQWELRGLVFVRLVSQIILAVLGNRRKYGTYKVIDSIVWLTYLLADKVPTIALGVISSKLGDYYDKHGEPMENLQMIAFWAPFLLMHIGGPDTITAYSLEDNELWWRHLVGLVVQTLFAAYIILLSWKDTNWLSCLNILMFIIGFVKYGERTWSLYSASINYCRDSHLSLAVSETKEISTPERYKLNFLYFKGFKTNFASLLSDVVLDTEDIEFLKAQAQAYRGDYEQACNLLNFQHGFWYDVLFTKAAVTHNIWGCISRLVTSFAIMTGFILYIVKHERSLGVDPIITYMLLGVAVMSEVFSIISLVVYSEWTTDYVRSISHGIPFPLQFTHWLEEKNSKKTSSWNTVGQCDFLTFLCCKKEYDISRQSLPAAKLGKLLNVDRLPVSPKLKEMLHHNALKKMESTPIQASHYKEVVKAQKLRRRRQIVENLEFHQSILLWHIVTNVCYLCDDKKDVPENAIHSEESKLLSDYLFYLLLKRRHMLPIGTGLLSLRDTLSEATGYCEKQKSLTLSSDVNGFCMALKQCVTEDAKHGITHRPIGRSVFHYALLTAHDFLTDQYDRKKIWEFLIELWIEILYYSAANCRVNRHAQEMSTGGEFISHIWLLQSLSCLLDQFQLTKPVLDDVINNTNASEESEF